MVSHHITTRSNIIVLSSLQQKLLAYWEWDFLSLLTQIVHKHDKLSFFIIAIYIFHFIFFL